jgi:aminoglycoside phosphotransferase (APT) family kinase protein
MSDIVASPAPHALLPAGLGAAVEAKTGARITAVHPRGGGGASREGAELTLAYPDGQHVRVYMNYDVHRAGAGDDTAFLREAAILRALSGPLADTGVRVARYVASIPDQRALLAEHVAGDADYNRLRDPAARSGVAADYMAQLAALHAIAVPPEGIDGMGRPRPIATMVADRVEQLRARNAAEGDDPLANVVLDWLGDNVPDEPSRPVIVHGDAGPANFLYAGGGVTALLDWELVHYGDPMADLAMLRLRMLFQPFVPLPEAFAAYEAAGGAKVDVARIRFWQLFFQAGFIGRAGYQDPAAPPPPNFGMNMVYTAVHRRVLAESLAEAAGVALPEVGLPNAPADRNARSFQIALDDLRDMIVPRLADQQAAAKAKGLARLVKWWRANERFGPAFDAATLAELSAALGEGFADVPSARAALARRVAAHTIDQALAIRLCHAEATRDAALMADAMGALARTALAPLA